MKTPGKVQYVFVCEPRRSAGRGYILTRRKKQKKKPKVGPTPNDNFNVSRACTACCEPLVLFTDFIIFRLAVIIIPFYDINRYDLPTPHRDL